MTSFRDERGNRIEVEILSSVKGPETMDDPFSVVPGFFKLNPPKRELEREFVCKTEKSGEELNWRVVPCDLILPKLHEKLSPIVKREVDFAKVQIFETNRVLLAPVWRTFLPLYRPESEFDVREHYDEDRFKTTISGRYIEKIVHLWTPAFKREDIEGVNMALVDDYLTTRIFSEKIKVLIESLPKIQMEFKEVRIVEKDGTVTGPDFMFD